MNAKTFIELLTKRISESGAAFTQNMGDDEHTFIEWLVIFIRWMEWGTPSDYSRYYRDEK